MEKKLLSFNWRPELKDMAIASIDDDFMLLDRTVNLSAFDYPFKVDVTAAVICTRGTTEGTIDLKPYRTTAPCLVIILPGQILEHKYISDDFSGLFVVMSKRFTDNLLPNVRERLPMFLSVQDNPAIPLSEKELEAMVGYFNMMKRTLEVKENPHRMDVVRYLTLAFCYGAGYHFHKLSGNEKRSNHEILVENFLNLAKAHYKEHRELEFYADKLCLTPKHLSKVIRETSNLSPVEWINSYVILEAKALLKSTNMTIQQISDELNFPSQSFFGKYFKRLTGVSPRAYKGSKNG